MDAKQEHHEHKKYNILKAIFVEATDFWHSDSFSSHTELVGEFLDFNLATFVDMASSSFDK